MRAAKDMSPPADGRADLDERSMQIVEWWMAVIAIVFVLAFSLIR